MPSLVHRKELTIEWGHCDPAGIVFNSRFFEIFDWCSWEMFEAALGMPRAYVIRDVCYRAARAGMITGVLLAVARISGETAPILFTALNNQFFSLNPDAPMASLPATIFQFALSPYADWQQLAWTGALIITMAVLTLNIVARLTAGTKAPT